MHFSYDVLTLPIVTVMRAEITDGICLKSVKYTCKCITIVQFWALILHKLCIIKINLCIFKCEIAYLKSPLLGKSLKLLSPGV